MQILCTSGTDRWQMSDAEMQKYVAATHDYNHIAKVNRVINIIRVQEIILLFCYYLVVRLQKLNK